MLRLWDHSASERVDQFVAISKTVQDRIKKYYQRGSIVIYPPVSLANNIQIKQGDFYLIVSRLFSSKNIHIAIEAFNKLGYELVIIGEGPERKKLQKMAGKNIRFLGWQDDKVVGEYYQNCKAFIMPQEEDFGITSIEAMSYGKPVLALRKGGALETIIEGETGEFFDDPIPEALAEGVKRQESNLTDYNPEHIRSHARQFSRKNFREHILDLIK